MMPKVKIDDDDFARAVAEDLLWHYAYEPEKKLRKALLRVAFFYMTFPEVAEYLGSEEEAREYFK